MNLKKYEAFIKIVELGSITAAARDLNNTQSGVTQLIASLEKELGTTLFTRNRSGILLTDAGKRLMPLIVKVLEADTRLMEAVAEINEAQGTIRIATFKSVAINWLPGIIKDYRKTEPNIRIELVDGGYNTIDKVFSEQHIDFGFTPLPMGGDFRTVPVYKDRLLAVLPKDHPMADCEKCPVSIFASEPVISLTEAIDRDARSVFSAAGIRPDIRYRVEDDYALLAMVEQGLGISIVPELILKGEADKVKVLELDPPAFRTIGIAFPDSDMPNPEAERFADFAADHIRKNQTYVRE